MLVRDVIKRALRMLGVIGSGREPKDYQATEGLEAFQAMILSFPGVEIAGRWIEQDVTTDVTAEEGDRLRVNSTDPITISLPISITPRERVVGCCGQITIGLVCDTTRAPKDGAPVWICDVYGTIEPRLYIYRADSAEWLLASALDLDSTCPLGSAFDAYLPAMLAVYMQPNYGVDLSPVTVQLATTGKTRISARYRQRVNTPVDSALLRLTGSTPCFLTATGR